MYKIMKKRQAMTASPGSLVYCLMFVLLISGCSTTPVTEQAQDESANRDQIQAAGEAGTDVADAVGEEKAQPEEVEADDVDEDADEVDPLEGFNRSMYTFNEVVDDYVAEPITSAYKWITPEFMQTGISNFYDNLKEISVVLNDVLQGKFVQGGQDTGRFLLNSTVGLAGLFDVATPMGLEQHDEDFGQTLAVWGVPTGPYLVVPFLGPTTFRGVPGAAVDAVANPVTYLPWGFAAVAALNKRANAQGSLQFIDEAALDPYVFTRESYLQWREFLATDGNPEISDDGFDEDLFDDEFDEDFDDDSEASGATSGSEAVPEPVAEETAAVDDAQQIQQSANGNLQAAAESPDSGDMAVVASDAIDVQEVGAEQARQDAAADGVEGVHPETPDQSFQQASRAFEEASRAYSEADQELSELQQGETK